MARFSVVLQGEKVYYIINKLYVVLQKNQLACMYLSGAQNGVA